MSKHLLALLSGLMLLAACETPPTDDGSQGAGGGRGGYGSTSGSSVPAVAGSQDDLSQNVGDRVFFAYDKFDIASAGQQVLQKQAAWLKTYPNVTITVEGHCDERGTREYNLALGDRRANAVKNYLVALGINANRVRTISYGKERPAVLGSNEAAWQQNRRGVSVVN